MRKFHLFLFFYFSASWYSTLNADGGSTPGEAGSKFLLIPQSARATALAGSYVSAQGDITGLDCNPAGLAQMENYQFSAANTAYPGGINYTSASIATKPYHGVGGVFRFRAYYLNDVQRDGIGQAIGGQNIPIVDRGYTLGIYWSLSDYCSLGYSPELVDRTLFIYRDRTIAHNLGMQIYSRDKKLVFGASVQNLGDGTKFLDTPEPLPLVYRFGIATTIKNNAFMSMELQKYLDNPNPSASAGLEWNPFNYFSIRGGMGYNATLYGSAGLGLSFRSWTLDYAVRPQPAIGISHTVTLILKWSEIDLLGWDM